MASASRQSPQAGRLRTECDRPWSFSCHSQDVTEYAWALGYQLRLDSRNAIEAARAGFRYQEVPVTYGCRIGQVSSLEPAVIGAGTKIIGLLVWHDLIASRVSTCSPAVCCSFSASWHSTALKRQARAGVRCSSLRSLCALWCHRLDAC